MPRGQSTGILVRDSQTQRAIRLLDLGRTRTGFLVLALGSPDRRENLQKAATRRATQNIATEPIAYSGTSSAPAQRDPTHDCDESQDDGNEGNLSYFNADTISCLTNH